MAATEECRLTLDVRVRLAKPDDAAEVTRIQVRAWREGYAGIVPDTALRDMTSEQAERAWRGQWEESIGAPPSFQHRVLVAVEGANVVGFAAHAPAADPDLDPQTRAELLTLLVHPAYGRRGHGSRLLNATVDQLREEGFAAVVCWVFARHHVMLTFLESAGWAEDGARRELDMGHPIPMLRLATDIT